VKKRDGDKTRPDRVPPSEASADAVERIAPRRDSHIEVGDIVVSREPVPRLKPTTAGPIWRYRVFVHPHQYDGHVYNGFEHAATEAERSGARARARVMYVEDSVPVMLVNYRDR